MKIVACYKCVPDSETITVGKSRCLDFSQSQLEIGQYDLRAVEAAMKMAADGNSTVSVLTAAGDVTENTKMKKAILSRGPQEMFAVKDAALDSADSFTTARTLAAGIKKIGDVDLVLCGEGSGDMYAQQTGNIVGGLLGWTTLNAVSSIEAIDGGLRVNRTLDDGVETLEIGLPAVLSVTADINTPRIPTMKDILGAGKKPSTVWSLADVDDELEAKTETLDILAPEATDRKRIILTGSADETLDEFVSYIKNLL